jgi:hypothetical protein
MSVLLKHQSASLLRDPAIDSLPTSSQSSAETDLVLGPQMYHCVPGQRP